MTLLDTRTEVLPPRPLLEAEQRQRGPLRLVVTIVASVLVLVVLVAALAEWIVRSDVERRIADAFRTGLGTPTSQHVDVAIAGLVLPQLLTGRIGEVTLSSPDLNIGPMAADVAVTVVDVAPLGPADDAELRIVAGEVRVGSDQASAMFVPDGGTGAVRIAFRGADMVLDADMTVAGQSVPFQAAVTPSLEGGRVMWTPASVTIGGTMITPADLTARLGADAAAALAPTSVCVADVLPAGIRLRDLAVRDQHLVFGIDGSSRLNARGVRAVGGCG